MESFRIRIILLCWSAALAACTGQHAASDRTSFTRIDSLTENYLALQDSMLNTWNTILKDENKKIVSMHELLHALLASQQFDKAQLIGLEQRLDDLEQIRFNQMTIADPHAVEEYDFASSSLIFEITTLTESYAHFQTNKQLQEWVDNIKIADQRIAIYRADYDSVTNVFNMFLDANKAYLTGLDQNLSQEKRPLFQMAGN